MDWTNVVPDTPCQDVLGFLAASGHCLNVKNGGDVEQETFCSAFDACVVWDEDDGEEMAAGEEEGGDVHKLDCSTLTECRWEGIHEHFLGDGICHDSLPGCYNSKVCNYGELLFVCLSDVYSCVWSLVQIDSYIYSLLNLRWWRLL